MLALIRKAQTYTHEIFCGVIIFSHSICYSSIVVILLVFSAFFNFEDWSISCLIFKKIVLRALFVCCVYYTEMSKMSMSQPERSKLLNEFVGH